MIGRNEGERLLRCLESVRAESRKIVYVDSDSSDGSLELARSFGVEAIELDMSIPFTAARARNAGFGRLREIAGDLRFVQFVDGDCELIPGWLELARSFLASHPEIACVCGRLRERFPERSLYNRLCDREWDQPSGAAEACGGIAMMHAGLFAASGGFNEALVAGEEPELCRRLRARGFVIHRLPNPMAWHDANILRFSQWWRRTRRVGYAYAQTLALQEGHGDRSQWVRLVRPWIWTALIPAVTLLMTLAWGWKALLFLFAYPINILRGASERRGDPAFGIVHSAFLLLGKVPEFLGQWQFWLRTSGNKNPSAKFDYKK